MKLKTPHDGVPLLIGIRLPRKLYLSLPQMDGPMLLERVSTRPVSYLLHHSTDRFLLIPLALSICSVFFVIRCWRTQASLPLPPGPRSLPIVGNMFDIPKTMSAYEYAALSQKYGTTFPRLSKFASDSLSPKTGDVVYLNALGKSLLVLSSMETAQDLLDKRSGNYSSKPPSAMADLYVRRYPPPRPCFGLPHAHTLPCFTQNRARVEHFSPLESERSLAQTAQGITPVPGYCKRWTVLPRYRAAHAPVPQASFGQPFPLHR